MVPFVAPKPGSSLGAAGTVPAGYLIPARMKLCTKPRWNSRKPSSSGAELIRLDAATIDQLTPWSGEAKISSPTVMGRVSTEFVTISGHSRLFQ